MKVLIVDDSKPIRRLLAEMLTDVPDISLVQAESGEDALQKIHGCGAFDLMLVDWNMPGMDGPTFVRTVRTDPLHQSAKILMVTTHNAMEDVQRAIECGSDDFLMKPITEREMLHDKLRLLGLMG